MRRPLLLLLAAAVLPAAAFGAEKGVELIGSKVRSKRWRVRREPHVVEEFSGDVVYEKEDRELKADWALYDHKDERLEAEGRIRGSRTAEGGGKVTLSGHRGYYDLRLRRGKLSARGPDDPVRFAYEGTGGGAQRWRAQAMRARYDDAEGSLTLEGRRPVFEADESGWRAVAQADRITARRGDAEKRRVTADGRAEGWVLVPDRGKFLGGAAKSGDAAAEAR